MGLPELHCLEKDALKFWYPSILIDGSRRRCTWQLQRLEGESLKPVFEQKLAFSNDDCGRRKT